MCNRRPCLFISQALDKTIFPMTDLINLTSENFQKVISVPDKFVMIDFWAPWCGPCKAIGPILEQISFEKGHLVDIYKVNVDENTDLAQEHGVQSIPTILLYKNGSLKDTIIGLKSKDELIDLIDQ